MDFSGGVDEAMINSFKEKSGQKQCKQGQVCIASRGEVKKLYKSP